MTETAYKQNWTEPTLARECGSCYACCVYLGIEELKKWTGQTCKHLDGNDPTKRCNIYNNRPTACSSYQCVWRAGFGPDNLQPNQSGILATTYPSESTEGAAAVTVIIFDEQKARKFDPTVLVTELLMTEQIDEVRLINYSAKTGILFKNNKIYQCKILPPDGYESLIFQADLDSPIGNFRIERLAKS